MHPDKNGAPRAGDAFKRLCLAFDSLQDPQKQADALERLRHRRGAAAEGGSARAEDEETDVAGGGGGGGGGREGRKWWEGRSWADIEREIQRQDAAYKARFARDHAAYEARRERKRQRTAEEHARVRDGLAELRAKYGIAPSEDSADAPPEGAAQTEAEAAATAATASWRQFRKVPLAPPALQPAVDPLTRREVDAAAGGFVCNLCARRFISEDHLGRHERESELHRRNTAARGHS